jgi:hypothetical protein
MAETTIVFAPLSAWISAVLAGKKCSERCMSQDINQLHSLFKKNIYSTSHNYGSILQAQPVPCDTLALLQSLVEVAAKLPCQPRLLAHCVAAYFIC